MTVEQDQSDVVFGMADRLFGSYVDNVDGGKVVNVRIDWIPVESDGETIDYPDVYIDGESAREVFKRTAGWTDTGSSMDDEVLEEGAGLFNDMMAGLDDAVEYQRDLRDLDAEIGLLAISADSGYFQRVRDDLESEGLGSVGDGESLSIARSLIVQDVQVLGDAAEDQERYNDCYRNNVDVITEKFDSTPGAYWVMVGVESGEIKAAGGQGTIPGREKHINMELGFEEDLFVYLRPKTD